jgi:hypothetical protein
MHSKPELIVRQTYRSIGESSRIHMHRAPVPEPVEEPLPGEHPVPQEEPVPSPNPQHSLASSKRLND